MQETENTFLQFIEFTWVTNWSVQYLKWTAFSYNKDFELVSIWDFLTRNKTWIDIQDWVEYKRVTIKLNNGWVFLRDTERGENIGTKKQFLIKEKQFLLSKIDARWGAFGVVPNEVDGWIITGNFWTFDVDYSKVNPYFLSLLANTPEFILFVENASNGTTNRHYLQEDLFFGAKIPLPSLEIQNKIVEAYQKNIAEAEQAEIRSQELEREIESYLMEELGIEIKNQRKAQWLLKYIRSSNLEKWWTKYILNNSELWDLLKSKKYNMQKLKDLSQINPSTQLNKLENISFIPMKYISDENGEVIKKDIIKSTKSKWYTKFKEWDLVWARITPCMQNWKSAIVNNLTNWYWCWSTEYHVIRNKNNLASIKYIHLILRLKFVLNFATNYFTGSAWQQRVPKEFLENLQIPTPPLEIQEKIVAHIWALKEEIQSLKESAKVLRESAKKAFEEEIFHQ